MLPSLIELLFPTTTASEPNLQSPLAQTYVKWLASLSLHDLRCEPSTIANERVNVDSELVNLCYREYPTFTSVHRCSSAVGNAFDDFEASLSDLLQSVPSLEQECRMFTTNNSHIQSQRRKAALLQEHEDKLLDMLEIPQLMETCVRNAYYQEALDLASHVKRIRIKLEVGIIRDVAEEAEGVLQLMASQLLGVLREPVKLPVLLKAVGYLRRLRTIGDTDLSLVFLSSRLHNYRARLVEIENHRGEPVRYLRKYIDLFRENVFDVISQFTTIFPGAVDDQLVSFACLCVDDLVDLVQRYVPRISADAASMSSILVQLGYCSVSFARVGLDFSATLANPFLSAIQTSYEETVSSAASLVSEALAVVSLDTTTPSELLIAAPHLQSVLIDLHSPPIFVKSSDSHTPPSVLASYPPLAQYVNSHMSSLNALRMLAPYLISTRLLAAQSLSILQASEAVLDYLQHALEIHNNASPDLVRSTSGARHSRTGSSPRAHLLRRNTETQLSSETLLARRSEAKRVCVAFADAWLHAITFVREGLLEVLEQSSVGDEHEHGIWRMKERVQAWISKHAEDQAHESSDMPAQTVIDAVPTSAPVSSFGPSGDPSIPRSDAAGGNTDSPADGNGIIANLAEKTIRSADTSAFNHSAYVPAQPKSGDLTGRVGPETPPGRPGALDQALESTSRSDREDEASSIDKHSSSVNGASSSAYSHVRKATKPDPGVLPLADELEAMDAASAIEVVDQSVVSQDQGDMAKMSGPLHSAAEEAERDDRHIRVDGVSGALFTTANSLVSDELRDSEQDLGRRSSRDGNTSPTSDLDVGETAKTVSDGERGEVQASELLGPRKGDDIPTASESSEAVAEPPTSADGNDPSSKTGPKKKKKKGKK